MLRRFTICPLISFVRARKSRFMKWVVDIRLQVGKINKSETVIRKVKEQGPNGLYRHKWENCVKVSVEKELMKI
jgi:hypothetical protein